MGTEREKTNSIYSMVRNIETMSDAIRDRDMIQNCSRKEMQKSVPVAHALGLIIDLIQLNHKLLAIKSRAIQALVKSFEAVSRYKIRNLYKNSLQRMRE